MRYTNPIELPSIRGSLVQPQKKTTDNQTIQTTMKKTLISLLLLMGVATGATTQFAEEWRIDFGYHYSNSGQSSEYGYKASGNLGENYFVNYSLYTVSEYGFYCGDTTKIDLMNGTFGSWDEDFQFSVNLTTPDNDFHTDFPWPVIAELETGGAAAVRFGPYCQETDTNLHIDGHLVEGSVDVPTPYTLERDATYTFTLTKLGDTLTLSVYDHATQTTTNNCATAQIDPVYFTGDIERIIIGGREDGDRYNINATIHSVSMSKVSTVPEPATAALSLLALCGLAARRRR